MTALYVINSNGEQEPFSRAKVYRSARRVGASKKLAEEISRTVEKEIHPGVRTSEIFARVKALLSRETPKAALRFNLKEGIRKLGPTGFPFEKFVGEILKKLGFEVKINLFISGFCLADYEIDFLAQKEKTIYVGECKYRNFAGEMVHLRDALANYARFLDILKGPYFQKEKKQNYEIKTMMVTNEKFTSRATGYFSCAGVGFLGWKSPKNSGLEYLIETKNLYPVTILPSLQGRLKETFVSEKLMLARDVLEINPQEFSRKFQIPPQKIYNVIEEAKILLGV